MSAQHKEGQLAQEPAEPLHLSPLALAVALGFPPNSILAQGLREQRVSDSNLGRLPNNSMNHLRSRVLDNN